MAKLDSHLSQLKDFLTYLATVKGDLSNVTAPPFVLAPKSAIEVPACWAARHALFLQPAREPEPARRALLVAKNFVCSLAGLVDVGSEYAGRKPLNPFLGELFLGTFAGGDDHVNGYENGNGHIVGDSKTTFIAEQVSHHPPVTACVAINKKHAITSTGYAAQETSFSPTSGVTVRQVGHALIHDRHHDERHLMTLPTIQVRGITTGQLYPELQGLSYISSSSGFLTKIEFEGKGTLGLTGTSNKVTAVVYERDGMRPLYRIDGQWSGTMSIEDLQGNSPAETFHIDDIPLTDLTIAPLDQQTPWESRRAWSPVLDGIREGDLAKINEHKTAIEESQRRRRREEKEPGGTAWTGLFFERKAQLEEEEAALLEAIPDPELREVDAARTAGVWGFVGIEAAGSRIRSLAG